MKFWDSNCVRWSHRKLLEATESADRSESDLPLLLIISLAGVVSLVSLLILCACGESGSEAELKKVKKKTSSNNVRQLPEEEDVEAGVEIRTKSTPSEPKGVINENNHVQQARQSQASTTSSQMRPTSLRELPELPPCSPSLSNNEPHSRASEFSNDDYDHIGKKPPRIRAENYDHITLESPSHTETSETSQSDPATESHYAQVSERTYEACDTKSSDSKMAALQVEPPYNKIKDDEGEEPVVTVVQVEDDPTYNHFKDNASPYNKIADVDPYNHIMDDPYCMPGDENAQFKVEGEGHYELEPVEEEGLYNTVDNENVRVEVVSLNMVSSASNSSDPFKGLGNVSITEEMMPLINAGFSVASSEEVTDNDYAVVNKGNHSSSSQRAETHSQGAVPFPCPPEPPRGYAPEEVTGRQFVGTRETGTTSSGGERHYESGPPLHNSTSQSSSTAVYNERKYSKVSARESLASMSARNALNPYEDVIESENTYATVDGGSGDGVVTTATPAPPSSPIPSTSNRQSTNHISPTRHSNQPIRFTANQPITNRLTNSQPINSRLTNNPPRLASNHPMNGRLTNRPPNNLHNYSMPNETYAEIGQSGGAPSSVPSVPIPPSLDSLHLMKKHEKRHLATPEDTSLDESVSNSNSSKRSSFSPTTALPGIPPSNMATSGHETDIVLDPDYQKVKDYQRVKDTMDDNDPNYESVEEARAKFPGRGGHVYEEVSPTGSQPTSPENIRERVLNRHTYEDIVEVKEQKKNLKARSKSGKK